MRLMISCLVHGFSNALIVIFIPIVHKKYRLKGNIKIYSLRIFLRDTLGRARVLRRIIE